MASYAQIATLRNSSTFRDRVELSVVFYAQYILGEAPATTNHAKRYDWARNAYASPSGVAAGLLNAVALDSTIQSQLEIATDAQVQAATEAVINKILQF